MDQSSFMNDTSVEERYNPLDSINMSHANISMNLNETAHDI